MKPSDLEDFYTAKRQFSALLHHPDSVIRVQLFPGALVAFNNRRVLHSRSAIKDTDGPRHLQGCYVNADGIKYNYERLSRLFYAEPRTGTTAWKSLATAVKADFEHMGSLYHEAVDQQTSTTFMNLLKLQRGKHTMLGANVNLYEHALQTASRALRAGEDAETIVVSLMHDVFETTVAKNHGELAAALLAPWVSPKSQWMLAHHEIFQGFYYYHHYGGDRELRQMFNSSPFFNSTKYWCQNYDQNSFDPDYPSLPLSAFEPALNKVLSKPQYWWNPSHPKAGAVSISNGEHLSNPKNGEAKKCVDTWTCH